MTVELALNIAAWQYPSPYNIYSFSNTAEELDELMNGEYLACLNTKDELLGYYCYGYSARIPADAYTEDRLDLGLGMHPNLCGKGLGLSFLKRGMDEAKIRFGAVSLRLSVAQFNARAIRVYKKAGFTISACVRHRLSGLEYFIMIADLNN